MRRLHGFRGWITLVAALAGLPCRGAPQWTRLDAANFTILSQLSVRETRSWAVEFEQFHRGLGSFLRINEKALRPVTVILFASDRAMRGYKPLENGKPAKVSGYFTRCGLGNFIELAGDDQDRMTRLVIFHEGVHWLTNVSDTPPPLWLAEGLAEAFSTFSTEGNTCTYGEVLPWHVALLNHEDMMPLKELIKVRQGSLLYNEGDRTSIFYAESWAFVHYLIFSGKREIGTKFNELMRALHADADPDAAFMKVFGVNCAGMDKRLRDYLSGGDYTMRRMKFDRTSVDQSFKVRPATASEVNLTLCCELSAVDRPDEAIPRLDEILLAEPKNTAAWEARGFCSYQTHDFEETKECFRHAAALGSLNYFVYSFLGDAALGVDPGTTFRSPLASDPRTATDYYEQELAINPMDQHAYDNIAASASALDPVTAADARTLVAAAQLYPRDAMVRVGIAAALLKQGPSEAAVKSLHYFASDTSPEDKDAAAYAKSILEVREQMDTEKRLNGLIQDQDFDGVVALTDEALKSPDLEPQNRSQLEHTRAWAKDVLKVKRAQKLLGEGQTDQARALLLEADAENAEPELHKRILEMLDNIPGRKPGQ